MRMELVPQFAPEALAEFLPRSAVRQPARSYELVREYWLTKQAPWHENCGLVFDPDSGMTLE